MVILFQLNFFNKFYIIINLYFFFELSTLCYDTIEDSVLSVTCTCNNTYHRDCVKILNQIPESQLATTVSKIVI